MLNKIILATIRREGALKLDAMIPDIFEKTKTYRGWLYPFRYLLTLRYLKIKQSILAEFQNQKTYPIANDDYQKALINKLLSKNRRNDIETQQVLEKTKVSPFAFLFKAKFIYPVLLIALAAMFYQTFQWQQQKRIENVLANYLPYYSDLLHRKLLLKHNDGSEKIINAVDTAIQQAEDKILNELPEKDGVRAIMQDQLTKLKDPGMDSEKIMLGFKDVNTIFDAHKQPYYLSPKSFTMPCSSFIDAPIEQIMMLKELESLMSKNNPELCRTTMMTTYKVDDLSLIRIS